MKEEVFARPEVFVKTHALRMQVYVAVNTVFDFEQNEELFMMMARNANCRFKYLIESNSTMM